MTMWLLEYCSQYEVDQDTSYLIPDSVVQLTHEVRGTGVSVVPLPDPDPDPEPAVIEKYYFVKMYRKYVWKMMKNEKDWWQMKHDWMLFTQHQLF